MSEDKEIFHFVEFSFSIPARGKDNNELREYAQEQLAEDYWDIIKDMLKSPEYAQIGEVIEEAELIDYFFMEEE